MAKPKAEKTLVSRKLLRELIESGQRCSNCCFNLSQNSEIKTRYRNSMNESADAWDKASLQLHRASNL